MKYRTNKKTITQKECPLVADMGTPADCCDMTPTLKSDPDAPPCVKEVQEGGGSGGGMVGQARMLEKGLGPKADHGTKAGPAGREPTRAELMTP